MLIRFPRSGKKEYKVSNHWKIAAVGFCEELVRVDPETQRVYEEDADEFIRRYDSVDGGVSDCFSLAFPAGSVVLDIGFGSGRDLKRLREHGCQVHGVDPCDAFVFRAASDAEFSGSVFAVDSLPELSSIGDALYDGVLCSAVLMHIPEEELFDSVFSIRRVLKEHGRVLISISHPDETIDAKTKRDEKGRLFNGMAPGELELIFERVGFRLLHRSTSDDGLHRAHRKWETLLFELESQAGSRPIDTIESVLNKDNKVATYKLALFRSLADIAVTNYKLAGWAQDGRVKVPISSLAEKWVEYYWPIIEADLFIPQTTGRPISFRKQLEALVDYYRSRGGLSAYTLDSRNQVLSAEAIKLKRQLFSKVKNAIKVGPVKYAGGGSNPVFDYDKSDKTVLVGNGIWKELSLMGPWVQDATILRWAELTSKISKGEIKPSTVIDCLLTSPVMERDVGAARRFYEGLQNKVCVWSDKQIVASFDLDHAIPFSLWKNNDLWNLLPADSKINGQKKDRLPARDLVKRRRDCVVNYWSQINDAFPARFEYEAEKLMGGSFDCSNWENKLFSTFAEAVEVTAAQRGVDRWDLPAHAATVSSAMCIEAEKKSKIIEFPSAEERFTTCIPFYPYAATAGIFNLDQYVEDESLSEHAEWIAVDNLRIMPDLFAMKITGHSMEPKIKDGDICIFRRGSALGGSRNGRIMLVKHHGILDADTNGQFTVKRYESERVYDEDGLPQHVKITLHPLNPDYDPIVIEDVQEEGEFQVIGEFVGKVE